VVWATVTGLLLVGFFGSALVSISDPDPGLYHPGESNHCGSGSGFRNTALFTEQSKSGSVY
jgi:hypothetical protein